MRLKKSCDDTVDVKMTRVVRILAGAVSLGLLAGTGSPVKAEVLPLEKAAADGSYEVKTILFADLESKTRPGRKLPVRVHYPAAEGAWPVVLISHGAGGNVDSNYAQARHLASHGYMVCCVEHVGSNTDCLKLKIKIWETLRDMTRDRDEVLGRPVDVKEVLDQVELWNGGHDDLWGKFNLEHVAVLGHSFGAYTALVLCGARPALDWLERGPGESLKLDKDFLRLRVGKGLGPDLSDPRIDVGVALSPQGPGEPFFLEGSYASINRPVLGISGSDDRQQGGLRPENRKRFLELTPFAGTALVWIEGADHTAFSDPAGSGQTGVPSASRESVQPVSRAATLYFLNAHLKGRSEDWSKLTGAILQPVAGSHAGKVEVLRKEGAAPAAEAGVPQGGTEEVSKAKPLRMRELLGGFRRKES